jgi:hypothetical protein
MDLLHYPIQFLVSDPKPLTPKQAVFIQELNNHLGNITRACDATGIGRRTYYDWKEQNSTFRDAVEDMHETFLDNAESVLKDAVFTQHNLIAAMFYLKCQGKRRGWMERQEIEQTTSVNIHVKLPEPARIQQLKESYQEEQNNIMDILQEEIEEIKLKP